MTERQVILTPEGLRRIEDELRELQTVRRQEVAENIRQAKDLGDVAENPEYETAKTEQAFLEGRISDLKAMLSGAIVVDASDVPADQVGVGSAVMVRDLDSGEEWEFSLVGSYEADPVNDRISYESPIGEALMGRRVGDVVEASVPAGKVQYEIVGIRRTEP